MPFTRVDLEVYITEHQLRADAAAYLRDAERKLARDVGQSVSSSVVVEYQSPKMGRTVNCESRNGENSYSVRLERDNDVIAYFEQPPTIDCHRTQKKGNRCLRPYTPDFLVLRKSGPTVIQVKMESEIEELLRNHPKDWVRVDGKIVDIPACTAFEAMALPHVVVSSAQLEKIETANIKLLLQARKVAPANDDSALRRACAAYLAKVGLTNLKTLGASVGAVDLTPLLRLIDEGVVVTDIRRFPLASPESCPVANHLSLLNDDVIALLREHSGGDGGASSVCVSSDILPLGAHLERGIRALERLEQGMQGRSARRWKAKIAAAAAKGVIPLLAVTPRYAKSGNHEERRPPIVFGYAEHIIRTEWVQPTRPSDSAMRKIYNSRAREWHPGYQPLSPPTFRCLLKGLKPQLARERGGNRAANAMEPPTPVVERAWPATRLFELASCDHYLCDIYCVMRHANEVVYVEKPWLTVLRDIATQCVLAVWLSFRPPSRRSCALILRECLRRHGRLPEGIIVDRGAEFRSVYFSALLAHCGVDLLFRPSGHPRYGAEAERYFGQFKSQWLSLRPGNTVSMREARAVSGSHKPEKLACMELIELLEDVWSFNAWLDNTCTGADTVCPAVQQKLSLKQFECSGIKMAYDETFIMATAVDVDEFKLDPQRGFHIGEFHYWHPKLAALGNAPKSKMSVRRDPENPYCVYALVGREWITCFASRAPAFSVLDTLNRIAEGVLVLDGGVAREVAHEDAECQLVRLAYDRAPAVAVPAAVAALKEPQIPEPQRAFEVDEAELEPLELETWND